MSAGGRLLERDGPIQGDLFSGTQVLERVLPGSGTRVRLRLAPLGEGRVRVVEAARRSPGRARFERWPEEEGREVAFERLGFDLTYASVFGGASA